MTGAGSDRSAGRWGPRPRWAVGAPLLALGWIGLTACDAGDVRLGPKPRDSTRRDAGLSPSDYELDLKLIGGRRHRVVAAVKGRDVRALLPRRPLEVKPGSQAFAVVPIGRHWERVEWRAVRVTSLEPDGTATVRVEEGRTFAGVPAALLARAGRERPKAGQAVRVGIGRGLPYGRVARVTGKHISVRTVWLGELREVEVTRTEVLPLPTGLQPGSPVVYRLQTSHRLGCLVASERKHRWVLGAEGVILRLPWTDVAEHLLDKPYRPGDRARATLPVSLRPVTVVKVLEQGVRYEVAWNQRWRRVVGFASLAPPE